MPTDDEPTYAALLTPPGRGAVASVVVEGPAAVVCADAHVKLRRTGALATVPARRVLIARWGTAGGEEIVVCRQNDQRVEIHCHGGFAAAGRIIDDLASTGCRQIAWADWVQRASPDPFTAEAARLLPQARTERTASILLDQYNGALRAELESLAMLLATGETHRAASQLQTLLARAPLGRHLVEPWRVVIAGPPNVGKSTLINALVGYQRAIVFDQPGTTRDIVTVATVLDGWPVELADTAGLHQTSDPLELAGIERAHRQIESADKTILLFDATAPLTDTDRQLLSRWPKAICVLNKIDLVTTRPNLPDGWLHVSARTGEGVEDLIETLVTRLVPDSPPPGAGIPITDDQVAELDSTFAKVRAMLAP